MAHPDTDTANPFDWFRPDVRAAMRDEATQAQPARPEPPPELVESMEAAGFTLLLPGDPLFELAMDLIRGRSGMYSEPEPEDDSGCTCLFCSLGRLR